MTARTSTTRTMPVTLREFSQWLDWVAAGKPEGMRIGDDAPAGELYGALVYESIAKEAMKPLEADKKRAMDWLTRYNAAGVSNDPQVTGEYKFAQSASRIEPEARKVNGEKFKSRYPALWSLSRDWTPYRSVTLAKEIKAPKAPDLENPLPAPPSEELPKSQWPVTWGQAFHRYQERIEELKVHKKVIDDAIELMGRLLTDERIKAEYAQHWDGHGPLEFTDGTKLQLDRLQFSQDRALDVIEAHEGAIDTSEFIEVVPEHEVAGSRRLVKINYEGSGEAETTEAAIGNPFEGL